MALRWLWWVAAMAVLAGTAACTSRPRVLEIPLAAVVTAKDGATEQDVKYAILTAAARQGWAVVDQAPGTLRATRTEGRQIAVAAIGYHARMYDIRYKDSRNMNFRRKPVTDMAGATHDPEYATIDRKYNEWVSALDAAIRQALAEMR